MNLKEEIENESLDYGHTVMCGNPESKFLTSTCAQFIAETYAKELLWAKTKFDYQMVSGHNITPELEKGLLEILNKWWEENK